VPGGTLVLDVPWAFVQPETDQLPGACKNWFTVQRLVDISNQDYGVTWLTPDAPLVQIGRITANLIGSMSLGDWITRLEPSQTVYSWVMNNHWHTNYRAEQAGPTVFRYFIIPHGPASAEAARQRAHAAALEQSQPILALPARGTLPAKPVLKVTGSQGSSRVQVTAFKPSEDGQAWMVRLFGLADGTEQVKLEWRPPGPKALWLSDNGQLPARPASGSVEVPAASLVTVRAEFAD
jgi:alpha-mannosidase